LVNPDFLDLKESPGVKESREFPDFTDPRVLLETGDLLEIFPRLSDLSVRPDPSDLAESRDFLD